MWVVGSSGAGKTTLARGLAARLGVPHVELDALFHLPDWGERPTSEFRALVLDALAGDGWVVDGNYRGRLGDLPAMADTIVWLDYPRRVAMARVIRRTLRRVVTRERLWAGNREPWSNLWSTDPQRSIIAWTWTQHARRRREYGAELDERWVRLRSPGEARRWLDSVSPAAAPA